MRSRNPLNVAFRSVAGQHLIGQPQTFGCHYQSEAWPSLSGHGLALPGVRVILTHPSRRCSQTCRELRFFKPATSDRLPVHRSESPTGYSSAGCSPAEPASASPVTDNISSIPIRRGNQMRCLTSARMQFRPSPRVWPWRPRSPFSLAVLRRQPECSLYFARRVTFLSCLRRQSPSRSVSPLTARYRAATRAVAGRLLERPVDQFALDHRRIAVSLEPFIRY
jgi:hypothetical protein